MVRAGEGEKRQETWAPDRLHQSGKDMSYRVNAGQMQAACLS